MLPKSQRRKAVRAASARVDPCLAKPNGKRGVPRKRRPNRMRPSRGAIPGAGVLVYDAPVSRGKTTLGTSPQYLGVSRTNPSGIRVRHREYITELVSGATANVFEIRFNSGINPGLPSLFPWLSNIAIQYESYRLYSFKLMYSSEVATSQAGSVLAAIDYDASDSLPASKQQLMAYKSSVRCVPWEDCLLVAQPNELHKLGPQRFIRSGAVASTDVKTYDCGNVMMAVHNASANLLLGEIYVEYDVELFTPQLSLDTRAALGSVSYVANGTVAAATPFGTAAPTLVGGLNVGPISTGASLGFANPGEYLVVIESVGTTFTDTLPVLTAVAASGSTVSALSTSLTYNAAATLATYVFRVRVNRSEVINAGICVTSGTVTLTYAATSATYTATTMRIAQYAYANA